MKRDERRNLTFPNTHLREEHDQVMLLFSIHNGHTTQLAATAPPIPQSSWRMWLNRFALGGELFINLTFTKRHIELPMG